MAQLDAGPRLLIRRLRQIMAEPGSGQSRLDRVVREIARQMVAEVSSVYVRRQDGSLELYATEGLNPEAVHNTHMKRGEGLVGLIAEQAKTINLPEARSHPAFSYRPETGEEEYHSFLGVPVLRAGRVLGVLTVQNRTRRHYTSEEEEALQTTAMVLAELLASGEVAGVNDQRLGGSLVISGLVLSEGIALGHIVLHEPRVVVTQLVSDDPEGERARLDAAIGQLRATIDKMLSRGEISAKGDHREVLEAYRMFALDRGWAARMREAVARGLTAEAAVERVRNDTRAQMLRQRDAFWRERFRDIDDLSDRLLRILAGKTMTAAEEEIPEDTILVARTMGPAELLDYDRARLRALVIEEGGPASHVAIVARALGIAALGQARGVIEAVESGDAAILDAESGELHIRPSSDIIEAYADKVRFRARRQKAYEKLRAKPAVTRDGCRIALNINAGLKVDLAHLAESGADGIGLFRTELEFMVSATFPRRERQTEIYARVLEAAGDKPVTFRALDIGGDKMLPYFRHAPEQNPALGWRAIRMWLDRPGLFRAQIGALLRAASGRELRVMLPMIAEVAEFDRAREIVLRESRHLEQVGREPPSRILLGAMVEVPAILWQLEALCERADFLSVGSNDLMQFLFAADRGNDRVADRFDPLSPVMLRVLKEIVEVAARRETPLTLCGEMAGRPLEAMALIGLGYRSISMAPANVGPIKAMVRSLEAAPLARYLKALLDAGEADVRGALERYAEENGVALRVPFDSKKARQE